MAKESSFFPGFETLRGMPYFQWRLFSLAAIFFLENCHMVYYDNLSVLYITILTELVFWLLFVFFEVVSLRKQKGIGQPLDQIALCLWGGFCLFAIVSELSFGVLQRSLFFLLIIPAFILMNREENFLRLFLFSAVLSAVPTILLGIFKYPLIFNSYSLVLAGLGAVLLSTAAMLCFHKGVASPYFYVVLFLLYNCVFLCYISGGRTGFVTIVLCICLFCLLLLLKIKAIPKSTRKNLPMVLSVLLLIVTAIAFTLYAVYFIIAYFYEDPHVIMSEIHMITPSTSTFFSANDNIIEKLWASADADNLLSNRVYLWRYTLHFPTWFGNGPNFFFDSPLPSVMNSAHNNWLAMFAHFGIPAAIFYTCFSFYMMILAVLHFFRSHSRLAFFPLFTIISFFVAGMVEDLAYLVPVRQHALLFYAACAYLIVESGRYQKERKQRRQAQQALAAMEKQPPEASPPPSDPLLEPTLEPASEPTAHPI